MRDTSDRLRDTLRSFAHLCSQDDRVLAAFVGGSLATGQTDEFSDLDLYAILRPEAYDQFLSEAAQFMSNFAAPVFLEPFDEFGFAMLVFILENGVQGELALAQPDRFLHIHGGPYEILVDKEGLLEGVEFPWQRPSGGHQQKTLRQELHWFWRDLSLCTVALGRGQLWTAAGYLESMRRRCLNLIRLKGDIEGWAEGYERVESVVGVEELELLKGSFAYPDSGALQGAVKSLIGYYRLVGPELAQRHELEYPLALEQVVMREFSRLGTDLPGVHEPQSG